MPIRVIVIYVAVLSLVILAWRDWFKSLCGLIVMAGVLEHSDMPKNIMGIQGLNLWNVLLVVIVMSFLMTRLRERLTLDVPRHIRVLLVGYLIVFLLAFFRMIFDRDVLTEAGYTLGHLVSERLINTIKWVIPGLLLFWGARTPRRVKMAVGCICLLCFLLALQVVFYMPLSALADVGEMMFRKHLGSEIGIHPSNLGKVIAGGTWAIISASVLLNRRMYRALAFVAFGIMTLAQVLVGSRVGYVAWVVVGFTMCLVRWRRYLVVVPFLGFILLGVLPGAADRFTSGFGVSDVAGGTTRDENLITAGRNMIWPHVIEKIEQSPLLGYGRDAMRRTGLTEALLRSVGKDVAVGHAHNAYLNLMLESGAIGLLIVLGFYAAIMYHSIRMFCNRYSPLVAVTGGVGLAMVGSHLAASIGSQNFFPIEADVGMWCAIALMLRVLHDLSQVRMGRLEGIFARQAGLFPSTAVLAS